MSRYDWVKIRSQRVNNTLWEDIAKEYDVTKDTIRGAYSRYQSQRTDIGHDGTIVSGQITSLEELYDEFGINEERWDVQRVVVNGWGENRQAKAWLTPRTLERDLDLITQQMIDAGKHSPSPKPVRYKRVQGGHLLELAVFDQHFAMLAWGPEVDGDPWDSKLAEKMYLDAMARLAATAQVFPIKRILVPLGNDLMHVDALAKDGSGATTTRGTGQDVDTRYKKMFTTVRKTVVRAIDNLKQIAPVDILIVPGNHDEHRMFYLGDSLEAWYRNDENVNVDNSAPTRKYYSYGEVLLGFVHGKEFETPKKKESLLGVMATERPHAWANSTWREWHLGHQHSKKELSYQPVEEFRGMRVRTIPALVTEDVWHYQQPYRHQRAAEAYLWHPKAGFTGMFSVNVFKDNELMGHELPS